MGAAAANFYAAAVGMQWQLLILLILLFTGTLGFLWVLFDERPSEIPQSVNIQENDNVTFESSFHE